MSAAGPRKLFVTDFDGTLTRRDFFWLAVDAFAPAHLDEFWRRYQAGLITHFEALAGIFANIRASDEAMQALLRRAELEPELPAYLDRLGRAGWDVLVVSAGCAWYIERILANAGVSLPVLANPGTFSADGGLLMRRPEGTPYGSPELGVDKAAVVREHLYSGRTVAFAGDGVPDREAARLVPGGLRFARADLARVLDDEGLPYRPFERWGEVAEALLEHP